MKTLPSTIVFALFFCVVFLGLHYTGIVEIGFLKENPKPLVPSFEPAPDANLQPLFSATGSQSVTIHQFSGKVIVLNFWASWCLPCQEEFPLLTKLAMENPDKLVLIAVSLDHDLAAAKRFIDNFDPKKGTTNHSSNVYFVSDPHWEMAKKYGVGKVPETYLIDQKLNMVKKIVGADEWKHKAIWDEIGALIANDLQSK